MALAFLQLIHKSDNAYQFLADTGTNRYFQYKVGKSKRRFGGLEMVDDILFSSPLKRQIRQQEEQLLRTDFTLPVPANEIGQDARFMQLFSFATDQKSNPALSPPIALAAFSLQDDDLALPAISFIQSAIMNQPVIQHRAFTYQELGLSRSMFWGALVGALPGLLQIAAPIVGKLMAGKIKKDEAKQSTKDGETQETQTTDTTKMIESIIALLGNLSPQSEKTSTEQSVFGYSASTFDPALLIQLAPLLEKILSPESISAIGDQPLKLLKAIGDAVLKMDGQTFSDSPGKPSASPQVTAEMSKNGTYSYAKIAPALLAALPALVPVLQKLLDPETIKAIGDQPAKLFKTIGDVISQMDKQEMEHLERLNPGVDDPSVERILATMSLSKVFPGTVPFKFEEKIDLEFVDTTTVTVQNRERVVYQRGKTLYFPLRIGTTLPNAPHRPFDKVILQLIVQDSDSGAVFLEKKFRLKNVRLNDVLREIYLSPQETERLPVLKDIKVEASFIWQNPKTRQAVGTFKNHYILLADEYLFDRMGGQIGDTRPLNDVVQHRAFWHKVWEGGFTKSRRWNIDFDLKYYYIIDTKEENPARLETRKQIFEDNAEQKQAEPDRRKLRAKMKSGMELTPALLNSLLPMFATEELSGAQLNSLKTPAFQLYFNQVARISVEMKGRSGDSATLWTYPEIALYQLYLNKVIETNPLGQVTKLEEIPLAFPKPASIHFIGTSSAS